MTCVELQESLAEIEDASSPEQRAHLKDCPECAALVAELLVIACAGGELRASHEPSPRVWNSIEIALRQEGLIRPQRKSHSLLPRFGSQWSWARWLAPAAALLLITLGIYLRQASHTPTVATTDVHPEVTASSDVAIAGLSDEELLREVALQSPALQEQCAEGLRRVNEYIQEARNIVAANPNDDEARRSLMEAYQEKAMLFELALDRSLQ